MQNNPLVSIVIPVHNGEKYIKESLDSCIGQTNQNIEIIVVNDASTDSTLEILQGYGDKIKIITVEKQNGLGNVINIGIKESKGKYIARMDADDVMYPTRLEKQVEYLKNNPDCVAVGGQIDIIDSNSNVTGHREYVLEDSKIKRNMFIYQPFAHPAVMLRKSSAEEVGLYPEDLWKVEDVKFFFLLSKLGTFANVPDTVLKYRLSFNTQSQSNMLEHFKKTVEIRKWAKKDLGIKPSFRESVIWLFQEIGVRLLSLLPPKIFMGVFELSRKLFK